MLIEYIMCFNFSLTVYQDYIEKYYKAKFIDSYIKIFSANAFTRPCHYIIAQENPDIIQGMNWCIIPMNTKRTDEIKRYNLFNARIETLFSKWPFKDFTQKNKCIAIAESIFEKKEIDKKKYYYRIFLKDHKIFSMPGLFNIWVDPETGNKYPSFTIITKNANKYIAQIHDRSPYFFTNTEQVKTWLSLESKNNIMDFLDSLDQNSLNFDSYTVFDKYVVKGENSEKNFLKYDFL